MCPSKNHAICGECWIVDALTKPERCMFDGDVPVGVLLPVRIIGDVMPIETCCFCGQQTKLGAYIREPADSTRLFKNRALPAAPADAPDHVSVEEQERYSDSERPK